MTDRPESSVDPSLRVGPLARGLGLVGLAMGIAALAHGVVTGRAPRPAGLGARALAALAFGGEVALRATLPVLGFVAVVVALGRVAPRLARRGTALAGLLAAAPIAATQAAFLTSGESISRSRYVVPVRVGLFVALAGLVLVLLAAAVRVVAPESESARLGPTRHTRGFGVLVGLAVVAGTVALAPLLPSYAYFAGPLLDGALVACGLMLLDTLRARPKVWLGLAAAMVVGGAVARSVDAALPTLAAPARAALTMHGGILGAVPLSRPDVDAVVVPRLVLPDVDPARCAARAAPASRPAWPAPAERRRNVVLISVDALRRDALGAYGGSLRTPALDAFASRATVFDDAHTTFPATLFAMGGALSGRAPNELLLSTTPGPTVLVQSAARVDRTLAILPTSPWFSYDSVRDFLTQSVTTVRHADANRQVDAAITALQETRARNERIALWLHLYEPHEPWEPHPGVTRGKGGRNRYAGEVEVVDLALARFFATLDALHFEEDTLVVVFADHGEALGERSYTGHHVHLYGFLADVPLFVRAPGLPTGRRHETVALPDVAATVLHFLDLPAARDLEGRSLALPALPDRPAVSEAFPVRGSRLFHLAARRAEGRAALQERAGIFDRTLDYEPKSAMVFAGHRYVLHRVSGREELFDRQADPRDEADVSAARPEVLLAMRARLAAWYEDRAEGIACRAGR